MQTGKGCVGAVLLLILFGIEIGLKMTSGIEVGENVKFALNYLVRGNLTLLIGMGVWGTWQYRRLNRQLAEEHIA